VLPQFRLRIQNIPWRPSIRTLRCSVTQVSDYEERAERILERTLTCTVIDHLPDPTTISSTLNTSFQNLKLDAAGVTKFGNDQLDAVFGRGRDGKRYLAPKTS
jgi:hypothetical protein